MAEDSTEFEDADPEDEDAEGYYYLVVPDQIAITQMLRLWEIWKAENPLPKIHEHWSKVFECLRDLRRWGPKDRVSDADAEIIAEEAEFAPQGMVRLELELVFTGNTARSNQHREEAKRAIVAKGGIVRHEARWSKIAYDALLADIPVQAAQELVQRRPDSLAYLVEALAIRPQSIVEIVGEDQPSEPLNIANIQPGNPPIAAILDAVPIQNHPVFTDHLEFDDPEGLEEIAVGPREHGTAMASLLVRGDLQKDEAPLGRRIYFRPLLHAQSAEPETPREVFPSDQLLVDQFVGAILRMKQGTADLPAVAPSVLLVNLSLGDKNHHFAGRISPWARAVDWLAYEYGILFFISAGNAGDLEIHDVRNDLAYQALEGEERARTTLAAVRRDIKDRRLLSPAEAVNAITVGALHEDACESPQVVGASIDPLPAEGLPSQITRLGLGFRNSLKPDILMPGGRLRVSARTIANPLCVRTSGGNRFGGLRVAGWKLDPAGNPTMDGWSGATSGATVLATRAAHKIYDAVAEIYPDEFLALDGRAQALVVKALLTHRSSISLEARTIFEDVFTGAGRERNNHLRRFYGFGVPSADESVACITSRATLWGAGSLGAGDAVDFRLPLPDSVSDKRGLRLLTVTLAWFTPIIPGRSAYRSVRLTVDEPKGESQIAKQAAKGQAERLMVERGTLFHRQWHGTAAHRFNGGSELIIPVVRKLDPNITQDLPELIPFGVAASFETSDVDIPVYEEVRQGLIIQTGVPVTVQV